MLPHEIWQAALGEIELNISKANFVTWFNSTQILKIKDGIVTIGVPSAFSKSWLENKYYKIILRALRNISPEIKDSNFILYSPAEFNTLNTKATKTIKKEESEKISPTQQATLEEISPTSKTNKETNLNPKYALNNFVVGPFNEIAYAAGQAIIKDSSQAYNPLFIYGSVGLGKTHLLQAIGNEIIKKYHGQKKVQYFSAEKFTNEFITALSLGLNKLKEFKDNYRKNIDILIVDDFQFLAGKQKVQEEFFHTFNTHYQKNKQLIISSDRPPKSIPTLEDRLRSRLEGGLIADITYPDLETRMAILKTKTQEQGFEIANEIINYLASHVSKNIRELEGALNKVIMHAKMRNIIPTLTQVKKDLAHLIAPPKKKTNFKNVIQVVADFYDVTIQDLINKCRKKELILPRQMTMFLLRKELCNSYPFIGEKLGGRDHSTVMYACEKLEKELEENETMREELNLIKERIYNI